MLKSLKEGGKVMGRGMRLRIDEQVRERDELSFEGYVDSHIFAPLYSCN